MYFRELEKLLSHILSSLLKSHITSLCYILTPDYYCSSVILLLLLFPSMFSQRLHQTALEFSLMKLLFVLFVVLKTEPRASCM